MIDDGLQVVEQIVVEWIVVEFAAVAVVVVVVGSIDCTYRKEHTTADKKYFGQEMIGQD